MDDDRDFTSTQDSTMNLLVFPGPMVKGWVGFGPQPRSGNLVPFEDFIEGSAEYGADSHFVCYVGHDDGALPRLKVASLEALEDLGTTPRMRWVALDIDRSGHSPWPSADAVDAFIEESIFGNDRLIELLGEDRLEAAHLYSTNAGLRVMWELSRPLHPKFHASLVDKLMAIFAEAGVPVDKVSREWSRLFRTPHAKRADTPVRFEPYAEAGEGTLDPYVFGELTPAVSLATASDDPLPTELPELSLAERLKALRYHPWALAGEPVPAPGGVSTRHVLKRAISSAAYESDEADPARLMALFFKSVAVTPKRTHEDVWELCKTIAAKQASKANDDGSTEHGDGVLPMPSKALFPLLRRRALQALGSVKLDKKDADVVETFKTDESIGDARSHRKVKRVIVDLVEQGIAPDQVFALAHASCIQGGLNGEVLWSLCQMPAQQAVKAAPTRALEKATAKVLPIFLSTPKGTQMLTFDSGEARYRALSSSWDEVLLVARDARYEEFLGYEPEITYQGRVRPRSRLLETMGRSIEEIEYHAGADGVAFHGSTLVMPCHRVRPVEAVEHPEVHEWLVRFGGNHPDLFLDWLACYPNVDRPIAALYFHGPSSTGKGMLAAALDALSGGMTRMRRASARFNASLLASPLLVLDEGVRGLRNTDEWLREMIGNAAIPVERKYQDSITVRSNLRILITANTADALPMPDVNETGYQAIMLRLIYIKQTWAPATYLEQLGGREYTSGNGWVNDDALGPGKIAEHIMWLHKNRPVKTGQRLLVQGNPQTVNPRLGWAGNENRTSRLAGVLARTVEGHLKPGPSEFSWRELVVEWDADGGRGVLVMLRPAVQKAWRMESGARAPAASHQSDSINLLHMKKSDQKACRPGGKYDRQSRKVVVPLTILAEHGGLDILGCIPADPREPEHIKAKNAAELLAQHMDTLYTDIE